MLLKEMTSSFLSVLTELMKLLMNCVVDFPKICLIDVLNLIAKSRKVHGHCKVGSWSVNFTFLSAINKITMHAVYIHVFNYCRFVYSVLEKQVCEHHLGENYE